MNNRRNYYRILHVQPDAPTQVIRASYRTLMQRMKLHPDLGGDTSTASLINEAWAVLRDPAARAEYDRSFDRYHRSGKTEPASGQRGEGTREKKRPAQSESPPRADRQERTTSGPRDDCCHFCGLPHGPTASIDILDDCGRCASPLYPAHSRSMSRDSQRAIDRHDRRHHLTFFTDGDTTSAIAGQTRDISPNGLQFVTDRPPRIGQVIKLVTPVCVAVARVVNARPCVGRARARWQVGVTFLTLRFERTSGSFVSATV